ncbi:MAG: replication initiation factor [Methylotenera sp.]|nr:replication initiation factor [Methylotenera sp.]
MSKNSSDSIKSLSEIQSSTAEPLARAAADGSGDELGLDTAPSNTVSNKYNNPNYYQPLRWGIDSLYVSFAGELHLDQEAKLEKLKKLAQADLLAEQALSQVELNDHLFEVKDKGTGMFPFTIEDNCFRINLSRRRAKSMPMAYVKISSEYLTHKPVLEIIDDLILVLSELGVIEYQPKVSRIDLFVDFASIENMESWHREAWVTRSEKINQYAVKGEFSGWPIGMGSGMAARLYNKLLEIATSNKGYLVPLWNEAGWDGETPIWRLEFELKRDILSQFDVQALNTTLANLNGLWSYATTEWLKLTIPSEADSNRSRWPIHPLWAYLSSVDFETSGGALSREFSPQRIPSDRRLFDFGFSVISSFMARDGINDLYDGVEAFYRELYHYLNNRAMNAGASFDDYVNERIALKAKRFNSILNKQLADDEALDSEAYRKASDGE